MGHQDVGPKPIELLVADAFYLAKVFDFRERTVRSAVFDHPLRQLGTNPRQCFQIGELWHDSDPCAGMGQDSQRASCRSVQEVPIPRLAETMRD